MVTGTKVHHYGAARPTLGDVTVSPSLRRRGTLYGITDPTDRDTMEGMGEDEDAGVLRIHNLVLERLVSNGMDYVNRLVKDVDRDFAMRLDEEDDRANEQGLSAPIIPEELDELYWTLQPRSDERTIVHDMISLVGANKLDPEVVESFTKSLVEFNPDIITYRTRDTRENVLELALTFNPKCQGIIKAICEHGMVRERVATLDDQEDGEQTVKKDGKLITIMVPWNKLIEVSGKDSCLHKAIKQNFCADYLLQRMHRTREQEKLLFHRGYLDLTPLHLAVEYKDCNKPGRVELVKHIINICPKALEQYTSRQSLTAGPGGGHSRSTQDSSGLKDGLAPCKYLDESRLKVKDLFDRQKRSLPRANEENWKKIEESLRLGCMRQFRGDRELLVRLLNTKVRLQMALQVYLLCSHVSNSRPIDSLAKNACIVFYMF